MSPCVTFADLACVTENLYKHLSIQSAIKDAPHSCKKPCQAAKYEATMKANPDYRKDFMKFFADVGTNDIVIMEEYLVYDFNDIVSSVGGSLGLFLGFSCLEVCRVASKMVTKKNVKSKKKPSKFSNKVSK